MENIPTHIIFVKDQIRHYEKMVYEKRGNPKGQAVYVAVLSSFKSLLSDLEIALTSPQSTLSAQNGMAPVILDADISAKLPLGFFDQPLAMTASDLFGLPDSVKKELALTESDKLEILIVNLINLAGGTLILDKIITGLFHLTGEVHQRTALTGKLYRMNKKGLVFGVPKKKGAYTTTKPTDMDVDDESDDSVSDLV